MNKKKENTLVPRLEGAVEKTASGVNRISSSMISDTLALVKREQCELPLLERNYRNKDTSRPIPPEILKRLKYLLMMKKYLQDTSRPIPPEVLKRLENLLSMNKYLQMLEKSDSQTKSSQTKLRIGGYEWHRPDYCQILIWAMDTGLKPVDFVAQLLHPTSVGEEDGQPDFIDFFKKPIFAKGKLLKVNIDSRLLRGDRLVWTNELEITHLRVTGKSGATGLSDLGLLPLSRLAALSCCLLGLTHLDLTRLPWLEYLNCSGNRLEKLQLDFKPQLSTLYCNRNELAELRFHRTPNLKLLDCWHNKLIRLDLSGLYRLKVVFCGKNRLSELKLANLPNLETLYCSKNHLHKVNLAEVPKLKVLDCSDNQISKLDLSQCPELLNLECSGNRLTRLDLSSLLGLTYLKCADNAISELDLSKCPNLVEVDCSGNPISILDIRGLKHLRVLNRGRYTKVIMNPERENTVQDLEAQFQMGIFYYFGYRLPRNHTKAARLFCLAAERGHIDSQAFLAECYFEGNGVPQDYGKAVEWYQKAAAEGNPLGQGNLSRAQANLGLAYLCGKGVSKNKIEACKCFKLAVEQGDKEVTENLIPLISRLLSSELKEANISEKVGVFFPLKNLAAIKVAEAVIVGSMFPIETSWEM
jgi:hypothetical protein